MHHALTRRFSKVKDGEGKLPDVLLVDGGKGQLAMAREVLQELAVPDLILLGVAKGTTRKPGLEVLYLNDAEHEFTLPGNSPALHLIQQIRDESHRFAITGHRARRGLQACQRGGILVFVGNLARLGVLPRTRPIVPGELAVSD